MKIIVINLTYGRSKSLNNLYTVRNSRVGIKAEKNKENRQPITLFSIKFMLSK